MRPFVFSILVSVTRVNVALLVSTVAFVACEAPSSSSSSPPVSSPNVEVPSDGSSDPEVPTTCLAPTGVGTQHGSTVGNETWTAAASPHILPYDTNIQGTVTIEPCAEVLIAGGKTVSVMGKIVARGTVSQRIHIGAQDASKPFSKIRTLKGLLDLAYTTIDGGGDRLNTVAVSTGMLDLQGEDETKPSQETIRVDRVKLEGSATNGIVLRDGAGFSADSTALTITGSAMYPMSIWARAVGNIPVGTYTGNANDEILLPADHADSDFVESTTLHGRGVPYHVGTEFSAGDLRVDALNGSGTMPTLTIEPGVTMRFKKGGVFRITAASGPTPATGALIAAGTADKPIVFTSAEASPVAGDWLGIWFGLVPSTTNKIDYARVEYAGGKSSSGSDSCIMPPSSINDAAIRILGEQQPFITNTTIANSASHGIDRGFRSNLKPSFIATNTFVGVAGCIETYPRDVSGACPSAVPCPH